MKANRFTAFADEDQVAAETKNVQAQATKVAEPKKKTVVKVAKAPAQEVENAEEFEKVEQKGQANRGGERGRGRGGRGGERGRGGQRGERGPRPERIEGEERRGGRGRGGRGDRPKTAQPTHADGSAAEVVADKPKNEQSRGSRGGRRDGQGKPGDRQDGTGRGGRVRKDGPRKQFDAEGNEIAAEERKEREPREPREKREPREPREKRERKPEEEKKEPEPVVEEEEEGFTLEDYEQAKKAKSQGLLKHNAARQHEKIDAKNIQSFEAKEEEVANTKYYTKVDVQYTKPGAGGNLLGFQSGVDQGDEFESRGGARGGRGGRGDRPRQDRPQTQRGGRKGGKLVVDDNEFPAL